MFSPDYVFIGAGVLGLVGALVALARGVARRQQRLLLSALLWVSLATGCFLQGFAPNLRVERNAFVMPRPSDPKQAVNPRELVERERQMKILSTAFLAVAALGLFMQYRGVLLGAAPHAASDQVQKKTHP